MNSPSARLSPSYRNIRLNKLKNSPIELKEKMRKDYKDKIQNCRNMLLSKFRGSVGDTDLRERFSEIYKSMFDYTQDFTIDDEELKMLEEIKNELVQEEYDWWIQEYDKYHMEGFDWSQIEQENYLICPICEKQNCTLGTHLSCRNCNYMIQTALTQTEIKSLIDDALEKHDLLCKNIGQFNLVSELQENHIYLICDSCHDMQIII